MRRLFRLITVAVFGVSIEVYSGRKFISDGINILLPFVISHGSSQDLDCQHIEQGILTHSKHKAHNSANLILPLVESRYQRKSIGFGFNKRTVSVLFQTVNNPSKTFTVLEPRAPGTCLKGSGERVTVRESAKQKKCILATSAGFFNTTTGECNGNIYSDGRLVRDSGGVQNVHFGVTADDYIFVGYLSKQDLVSHQFTQLVGGAVWLLRDGEIHIDESVKTECSRTTEMGLREFASLQKARIAVGHDKDGRILIAHVDVTKGNVGVDAYEMAYILLDLGFVNAINLDGGGSATTVINGTLVSHPSDECPDKIFACEREVSTILCVHEPERVTVHWLGNDSCDPGACNSPGHWSRPACPHLQCPTSCDPHETKPAGVAREITESEHLVADQTVQYR
ncbi:N-acetylglucosamine-1-phosphodiester alpha-N-acetylglucosaminidase-like [Haliotis rubra]|uniref:N-acetylglucosamine-1-phosphodiester alpha-N-acetylglucosaminidase-like n=1 Tax=Haliotis rubra TaxID=36100 RepID=UPI001EE59553|nr:N-acetylglucosamine-1-phosphodiester alpha-N-acetylglucosaminidase-like [Haliotis rubra]XP_046545113.1 N-acetylglucosamine-1-phosphodiester alpha-N-acetylglucosaminidase-like [Haliotis rubra]